MRLAPALPLLLVFVSATAEAAERGFFTGKRADVIAMLASATRPNVASDEALAIIGRAQKATADLDDGYVEFFIDQTLADVYRQRGDAGASASRVKAAMAELSQLMVTDGPAEVLYTLYLMGYDLQRPVASLLGWEDQFDPVQSLETNMSATLDEMARELEDPELDPDEREAMTRMHGSMKRMVAGLVAGLKENDVSRLRGARRELVEFAAYTKNEAMKEGLSELDRKTAAAISDMMVASVDLAIAGIQRNRTDFEKAARAISDVLKKATAQGLIEE